jgi:lycopene beta-cyclase
MDFTGIEVKRGFHFFYLLPFTESEALVESVYIGLDGLSNHEHRELLIDYLKKEYGIVEFNEVYVERGVIPMYRMSLERPHQQHYLIGTRGGFVRSSTGYAFAAIHQYADQLARSLESDRLPEVVRPLSPKAELLDAVLLNYLRERPEDGPLILSSLFEKVEPDAVVRFLSDRSTLLDEALIFAAMPKKFELASIMAKTAL